MPAIKLPATAEEVAKVKRDAKECGLSQNNYLRICLGLKLRYPGSYERTMEMRGRRSARMKNKYKSAIADNQEETGNE